MDRRGELDKGVQTELKKIAEHLECVKCVIKYFILCVIHYIAEERGRSAAVIAQSVEPFLTSA